MESKLLVLIMTLLLFAGCTFSIEKNEGNTDLQIDDFLISIGGVDDTILQQKLEYDFTISNKENISINSDSIEIILTDWMMEKETEHEITKQVFREDSFTVKGYVKFDSSNLAKYDIERGQPYILGFKARTMNGEEIFIKQKAN